jgi:regulatory protein YycI of two-component signal transduction system YycFG
MSTQTQKYKAKTIVIGVVSILLSFYLIQFLFVSSNPAEGQINQEAQTEEEELSEEKIKIKELELEKKKLDLKIQELQKETKEEVKESQEKTEKEVKKK